jgi:hypothetical protein
MNAQGIRCQLECVAENKGANTRAQRENDKYPIPNDK